jgi:hypothetical protein
MSHPIVSVTAQESTAHACGTEESVPTTKPAPLPALGILEHVVITVHGIRTYGDWQDRLERLIKTVDPHSHVYNYRYNYFSVVRFIVPLSRWVETRRFRKRLLDTLRRHPADSRLDIVAHSFGTHLVAWGLFGIPASVRPHVDTILFAGSVLRPDFPRNDLMEPGQVRRVINECGIYDKVLVVNQASVFFTGMAGRVGFVGGMFDRFLNRYHRFGHSGCFQRRRPRQYDRFMLRRWLPLLTSDCVPVRVDKRRPSTTAQGIRETILRNLEPIKVTVWTFLILIPVFTFGWLYVREKVARNAARRNATIVRDQAQVAVGEAKQEVERWQSQIKMYPVRLTGAETTVQDQRLRLELAQKIAKDVQQDFMAGLRVSSEQVIAVKQEAYRLLTELAAMQGEADMLSSSDPALEKEQADAKLVLAQIRFKQAESAANSPEVPPEEVEGLKTMEAEATVHLAEIQYKLVDRALSLNELKQKRQRELIAAVQNQNESLQTLKKAFVTLLEAGDRNMTTTRVDDLEMIIRKTLQDLHREEGKLKELEMARDTEIVARARREWDRTKQRLAELQ